jgi:hypothetical protein
MENNMEPQSRISITPFEALVSQAIARPLIEHIYTADPAAHVLEREIYITPHTILMRVYLKNDNGDHFDMRDYHVLSMDI